MSGPKTGSYRVISGAAVEQEYKRAVRAALRQLERLEVVRKRVQEAQSEFGTSIAPAITVPKIPNVQGEWRIVKVQEWTEATADAIDVFEDRLKRSIAEAERQREIEERREFLRREELARTRTDESVSAGMTESDGVLEKFTGDAPIVSDADANEQAAVDLLAAMLEQLDFEAEESDRRILAESIQAVAASTTDDERRLHKIKLNSELKQINESKSTLRERRRDRVRLLDQLEDVDIDGVEEIRAEIVAWKIDQSEFDPRFQARIAELVALEKQRNDQEYALRVARECLDELGYEVQSGFETALGAGGVGYARSVDMNGYAVRVRANSAGTMNFNVVRSSDAGAGESLRDKEVEESWCSDLHSLLGAMKEHGVDMTITRESEAGAVSVLVVDDLPFAGAGAATTAAKAESKAMKVKK